MQSARRDLQTLATRVLKEAPQEEAVMLAWPLACGSAVAERTRALSFQNGTLRVQVPDRGWQAQLQTFSAQYAHKISQLLGVTIEHISYEAPHTGAPTRR